MFDAGCRYASVTAEGGRSTPGGHSTTIDERDARSVGVQSEGMVCATFGYTTCYREVLVRAASRVAFAWSSAHEIGMCDCM